jgi:hypothetical protein
MSGEDMKSFSFNINNKKIKVNCIVNKLLEDREIIVTKLDRENGELEILIESIKNNNIDLDFQDFVDEVMEEIKQYNTLNSSNKEIDILDIFENKK